MEQLKALIQDMEKTSDTLQYASEHIRKLEKTVEYNYKRYKEAEEILEITYERLKEDRILRKYFPEIMEYMQEGEGANAIRGKAQM